MQCRSASIEIAFKLLSQNVNLNKTAFSSRQNAGAALSAKQEPSILVHMAQFGPEPFLLGAEALRVAVVAEIAIEAVRALDAVTCH